MTSMLGSTTLPRYGRRFKLARTCVHALYGLLLFVGFSGRADAQLFNSGNMAFSQAPYTVGSCTYVFGKCGTSAADGDVGLSGLEGATRYGYVSSATGLTRNDFKGLHPSAPIGFEFGSEQAPSVWRYYFFAPDESVANNLSVRVNFISRDGGSAVDYAWVKLDAVALSGLEQTLFTARTGAPGTPYWNGYGLQDIPPVSATTTVVPTPGAAKSGAPAWSVLGPDEVLYPDNSVNCFGAGCGSTGWQTVHFSVQPWTHYYLEFGVANWGDTGAQSGLAFDFGQQDAFYGAPIARLASAVPEPASVALMCSGLALVALALHQRAQE